MRPVTLSPENSNAIAKLAALIGWTPDELANHLLAETLEGFADRYSGALEESLGRNPLPRPGKRATALDRVTQMTGRLILDSSTYLVLDIKQLEPSILLLFGSIAHCEKFPWQVGGSQTILGLPGETIKTRLENQIAVVNGSSSGNERAIALTLSSTGATVICADLNKSARKEGKRTKLRYRFGVFSLLVSGKLD